MHISELNIYPIKSLKGISVDSAVIERRGLEFDRRWMLTSADGQFLTQREFPKMATVGVEIRDSGLLVTADGITAMVVPFEPATGDEVTVEVWGTTSEAVRYGDGVNQWFSQVLGAEVKLHYMPDSAGRDITERFNHGKDQVSFADGYPQLVISEASLADLNERLRRSADTPVGSSERTEESDKSVGAPLLMNRFRPNIVVQGSEAFAEDDWKVMKFGDSVFRSTKPCARCVMTTVDQAKGEFTGKEPLKTLATYRLAKDIIPDRYELFGMSPTAVCFGQNLIAESIGSTINVGDKVEVIEIY